MIPMTKEILNIINAVIDYKKFITSNNYIFPKTNFDWFSETETYYKSLPIPKEMNHNRQDFEHILSYQDEERLKILNNTNCNDLHYLKWKIY